MVPMDNTIDTLIVSDKYISSKKKNLGFHPWKTYFVNADDRTASSAESFLQTMESDLLSTGIHEFDSLAIVEAAKELVQNAQIHAYGSSPDRRVRVDLCNSDWYIGVSVHSYNAPQNLFYILQQSLEKKKEQHRRMIETRDVSLQKKYRGKFGIFLLEKCCDLVYANQHDDCVEIVALRVKSA